MIKLRDVCKGFDGREVISHLSLNIAKGERVCLSGASGCGKTTLLRLIAGLIQPDSGDITVSEDARISMLFQDDRLLPWCSALENITVTGADEDTARYYLDALGLAGEYHKYPDELSGGMCRRVSIARALAYGGDLYLLDEPVRGLDDGTAERVMKVLSDELRGKTAVIISHNAAEAGMLAQRVITMPRIGSNSVAI